MTITHIMQWSNRYTLVQHLNELFESVVSRFNGHLNEMEIIGVIAYYRKRDKGLVR